MYVNGGSGRGCAIMISGSLSHRDRKAVVGAVIAKKLSSTRAANSRLTKELWPLVRIPTWPTSTEQQGTQTISDDEMAGERKEGVDIKRPSANLTRR